MTDLITRVGAHIPDDGMRPYDWKNKKYKEVNWLKKDYKFERIEGTLIQSTNNRSHGTDHIIHEATPISSQGRAGSCVAQAWCDALEILRGLERPNAVEQLSRRFLYWTSRYYTGDIDVDYGTYLRSAAHQLTSIGIFDEKYFEYDDRPAYIINGGAHASPRVDHYTLASNNKLKGFYRIESTGKQLLQELEIAIRSNHPVVFGTRVSKDFKSYRGGQAIIEPPSWDESIGSHAMIITGVGYDGDKRWWLLRNSWSKYWGDDGHCKVSDDYVKIFQDVWVGTKMDSLV